MKNNSGFSLVELIVVIAIMAILAGVAVPTYSKYVTKANDAKVVAQLDEIKTAAFAAAAAESKSVYKINVESTGITVDVGTASATDTTSISAADVAVYFDGTIALGDGTYKNGAVWTSAGWTADTN